MIGVFEGISLCSYTGASFFNTTDALVERIGNGTEPSYSVVSTLIYSRNVYGKLTSE